MLTQTSGWICTKLCMLGPYHPGQVIGGGDNSLIFNLTIFAKLSQPNFPGHAGCSQLVPNKIVAVSTVTVALVIIQDVLDKYIATSNVIL